MRQRDAGRPPRAADYDEYAATYAWARFAVEWVLDPLERLTRALPRGARVLELGSGTGNYIRALARRVPDRMYVGLDRSRPMLEQARRQPPSGVHYLVADAAHALPLRGRTIALAFAVDVVQHLDDIPRFLQEACRTLHPGGTLLVVTDSEETLRSRSLTTFFPEILPIELARYPSIAGLDEAARDAGLEPRSHERVSGNVPLTDEFLERLDAKCSSAMRQIDPAIHAAGMVRVRAARERGETWHSCYDVLQYQRR